MKIKLTKDTRVALPAGVVIDVDAETARRIIKLGRGLAAEPVSEPEQKPAKKTRKKAE